MLKDLSGKTVHDLEAEDFQMLFCNACNDRNTCDHNTKTMNVCRQLIDDGLWDTLYRSRLQAS